jgi:very-short-patch-repair endonuclease
MTRKVNWGVVFLAQLRASRLLLPESEVRFHPVRRWRFDFAWPELMLALEIDGGIYVRGRHVTPVGFRKDCEKLNTALTLGWRVLRVVPDHIKSGEALEWVQKMMVIR